MTGELKILEQTDDHAILGGYGVVYGGKDLEGDTFTADTDYMPELVTKKLAFIDHTLDSMVEIDGKAYRLKGIADPVGEVVDITPDETGRYYRIMVEKANRYWELVEAMIGSEKSGLSTGSIPHLVRKTAGNIKRWPEAEVSLTLTPAEPRTIGVERLKRLVEENPGLKTLLRETPASVDEDVTAEEQPTPQTINITINEESKTMSDVEVTRDELETKVEALAEQVKTFENFSDRLDAAMKIIEALPAERKAGYIAPDNEPTSEVKSFGDFLVSVQRNKVKRLNEIYRARKDMGSTTGGAGGYLVPEEYSTALLRVMEEDNAISSRCFNQPVATRSGSFPLLDVFVTPTAGSGQTAMSSGLSPATVAEGAAYGEDQPTFELLNFQVKKIGEIVDVPAELIEDSGVVIETLLRRLFAIATDSIVERHILRGAGGSEWLGILNSAAAIGVTPATNSTFAEADALAMISRFKPMPAGNPVWIMHRGVIPDFNNTNFPANSSDFVTYDAQIPGSLHGYPILYSEHAPQDDNAGNVILADLSAYIIFNRRELTVAFSEHAKFENDLVVWKYSIRADGMPWMKSAITLADPQGSYTVSPFVYHND